MIPVLCAGFIAGRLTAPAASAPIRTASPTEAPAEGPITLDASFSEITDGDTLKLEVDLPRVRLDVRLIGVDTPEREKNAHLPKQVKAYNLPEARILSLGKDAEARANAIIRQAKALSVRIPSDGPRWSFGRMLAYVLVDGKDLGEALLRENLAWRDRDHRRDEDDERAREYDDLAKKFPGPQ